MVKVLFNIRYALLIAVCFLLINSLIFLFLGISHSIHAYKVVLGIGLDAVTVRPGLYLVEGLDSFMASIVFMISGLGIARVFVYGHVEMDLPKWLDIQTLRDLKILLWEAILVALVVYTLGQMIQDPPKSIESLYLPCIILILSLSLFLMRLKEHK